jgi:hypothetical protein
LRLRQMLCQKILVTLLILPGFGIISHIIVSAARKPVFGYLGMVYGAPLRLLFRCIVSQLYTKTSFYIGSVLQVAFVITQRGKAWGDCRLRCNTYHQDYLTRFLDKVMLKNLIRSAGTALSYWPKCVSGHVVECLRPCVQGFKLKDTRTAFLSEKLRAQEPKSNGL